METEKCIKILQDVIRINTENSNEKSVAEYYKNLLLENGIDVELIEYSEGRCSLVAEISNGVGKTLVISGHMDVVSAGDEAQWTHPPFSGHIEDGILWGRGASDMKAGLSALIIAMIRLNRTKQYQGKIKLLATVGEEIGELGSKQLTDLGYMNDVDALIIGEPCNVGIVYAHKGALNYRVISKGIAAHSSSPELGVNAIDNLLLAISEINRQILEESKRVHNEILGQTFHNVTIIEGGSQVNSIPDLAYFEANVRTIPEFDNNAVIHVVESVVEKLNQNEGVNLSVEVTADQPPVQANPKSQLIQTIIEEVNKIDSLKPKNLIGSMEKVLGTTFKQLDKSNLDTLGVMTVSGTTDAAQFVRGNKNVELAIYGPGMPMLNHKVDERIPISQYLDFIIAYERIISNYLK